MEKRKKGSLKRKITEDPYKPLPVLTRASLEPVRDKLDTFVQTLPGEKKIEHKYVMKVKGKCLNSFIGILKTVSSLFIIDSGHSKTGC